ncbi:LOW QUALITY PROTEIN: KICSTOR complex protein SZT2 [Mantella aurantiaca]
MAEKGDSEVEEAGQVFLLMKKDYRISRNVRLAWFLSNLYQPISSVPESELGLHDDELEVISVVPHGWQPDEPIRPGPFLLVPSTWVTFLARQYRFVIELDLSPSTGIVVGGVYSYDCSFGYVPNVELMKFIAMATLGSYLSSCPDVESGQADMNVYHKAFLPYSFMRTGEALNPEYYCGSQHKLFNEHLVSASSNPALATRRRKHAEKEVHADIISVVSVRLREGYSIREIRVSKALLEVKLVLLWKHNMRVEYLAMAPWPLDPSQRSTRVEVVMEGSYDILHDISCTLKKPITSMYRTSVIRRFWNTLQSISQTDQMLVHLKSFDTVPEHFKIPESTKNGVPLFYIPPGSTTPVLSLQHSDSDSSHSQFASYWKPILSVDANVWQRWLHVHRIVLLLEHDMPLPKHLHTPGNNGRYSTVQCRISHTALTSLLRDWSSFVLVESYSYVKLMSSDAGQTPSSFCVVRIIWKAPCMVLRLGFPLGTPANFRNKMVEELRDCILQLRFPYRVQSKDSTPRVKRKIFGTGSPSKSPPPQTPPPAFSDRCCLVLLHKPLEKLLIKYDKLPLDYRTPFILNLESPTQHTAVPGPHITNRSASSTLASLSRYFYHQRWIWSVQSGLATSVPTTAMAQILSTLTEIRLSEGFHFASSGEGIINMVLEVPIQSDSVGEGSIEKHSCVIQYILFPPHVTSTKDSFSTDEDNDTEVEAIEQDTELHLVSECWVEPQSGVVVGTSESWRHLHGLMYSEIPQALFPRDQSCINIMLTYEYIVQLCQNKDGGSPILTKAERTEPGESRGLCIREVPFHFDLMKLLPKCQQIELFFLTLSRAESDVAASDSSLPNDMLLSLYHGCLQSDVNDQEIPLYERDHQTFMEQVLQRDRDGHPAPFSFTPEENMRQPSTSETADPTPLHQIRQRETSSSSSTLQSLCPTDEDGRTFANGTGPPQWNITREVNPQHLLLTFLPATFSDVQKLITLPDLSMSTEGSSLCNSSHSETLPSGPVIPTLSVTPAPGNEQEAEHTREMHISFSRQSSLQDLSSSRRLRCPVYVYNCSLEALREQLVNPRQQRLCCDVFFSEFRQESASWGIFQEVQSRSLSQERPTAIPFIHPRQKELINHCNLLQEHYHQCYVKGLFKALQQSAWVSHQDLLTAVDYCEEQLQEVDITNFLMTLCGHLRGFRETQASPRPSPDGRALKASFRIGSLEQDDEATAAKDGSVLHSESSVDTEECIEPDIQVVSTPEPSSHPSSEFQLSVLESGHPCEVSLDLHRVIQDKFLAIGSLHFKTVPSNPHYFFYCPSSQRREENASQDPGDRKPSDDLEVSEAEQATEEGNTSTGGIVTESDPDLEVEYREHSDNAESLSGSETVNQDDDSFSVLGGDSLNGQDLAEHEMPPLFVHLICSVAHKNQHGSMPVLTLPTCLGEVIGCLENSETLQSISLGDLSVMLDIYVLTLPLEIEGVSEDSQHTRYTSESSVSFPRSPAQPSSYRSDEEIPPALERFPSNVEQSNTPHPSARLRSNTPHPSARLRSNTPHPSARLRSNTPHPSARLRSNTPHPSARLRSNTPRPSARLRSNTPPTHLLASAATPLTHLLASAATPLTHLLASAATPLLPICSPPQQHPSPICSPPQQHPSPICSPPQQHPSPICSPPQQHPSPICSPPQQHPSPICSPPQQHPSPICSPPQQHPSPICSPPQQHPSPICSPPQQHPSPICSPPQQHPSPICSPPQQHLSPICSPPQQHPSPICSPPQQHPSPICSPPQQHPSPICSPPQQHPSPICSPPQQPPSYPSAHLRSNTPRLSARLRSNPSYPSAHFCSNPSPTHLLASAAAPLTHLLVPAVTPPPTHLLTSAVTPPPTHLLASTATPRSTHRLTSAATPHLPICSPPQQHPSPICSPPQQHPSPICSPPQQHPSPICSPPQQPLTYPSARLRSNTPHPSARLRSNTPPTHLLASAATPPPTHLLASAATPPPTHRLTSAATPLTHLLASAQHPSLPICSPLQQHPSPICSPPQQHPSPICSPPQQPTSYPSARVHINTPHPSARLRSNPPPTHLLASTSTPLTHLLASAATPLLPICLPPQQHPSPICSPPQQHPSPICSPPQQPTSYPSARVHINTPHPSARLRSNTPHPSARLRSNPPPTHLLASAAQPLTHLLASAATPLLPICSRPHQHPSPICSPPQQHPLLPICSRPHQHPPPICSPPQQHPLLPICSRPHQHPSPICSPPQQHPSPICSPPQQHPSYPSARAPQQHPSPICLPPQQPPSYPSARVHINTPHPSARLRSNTPPHPSTRLRSNTPHPSARLRSNPPPTHLLASAATPLTHLLASAATHLLPICSRPHQHPSPICSPPQQPTSYPSARVHINTPHPSARLRSNPPPTHLLASTSTPLTHLLASAATPLTHLLASAATHLLPICSRPHQHPSPICSPPQQPTSYPSARVHINTPHPSARLRSNPPPTHLLASTLTPLTHLLASAATPLLPICLPPQQPPSPICSPPQQHPSPICSPPQQPTSYPSARVHINTPHPSARLRSNTPHPSARLRSNPPPTHLLASTSTPLTHLLASAATHLLPICSRPHQHPSPICSPPQQHPSPICSPPQQPTSYPSARLRSNTPHPSACLRSNPPPTHLLASTSTPLTHLLASAATPLTYLLTSAATPLTHLLASAATPLLPICSRPHQHPSPICSPPQQHPVLPICSLLQQPLTYPSARLRSNTPRPSARLRSNTPRPSARLRSNTPRPSARLRSNTPRPSARLRSNTPRPSARLRSNTPRPSARLRSNTPRPSARLRSNTPHPSARLRSNPPPTHLLASTSTPLTHLLASAATHLLPICSRPHQHPSPICSPPQQHPVLPICSLLQQPLTYPSAHFCSNPSPTHLLASAATPLTHLLASAATPLTHLLASAATPLLPICSPPQQPLTYPSARLRSITPHPSARLRSNPPPTHLLASAATPLTHLLASAATHLLPICSRPHQHPSPICSPPQQHPSPICSPPQQPLTYPSAHFCSNPSPTHLLASAATPHLPICSPLQQHPSPICSPPQQPLTYPSARLRSNPPPTHLLASAATPLTHLLASAATPLTYLLASAATPLLPICSRPHQHPSPICSPPQQHPVLPICSPPQQPPSYPSARLRSNPPPTHLLASTSTPLTHLLASAATHLLPICSPPQQPPLLPICSPPQHHPSSICSPPQHHPSPICSPPQKPPLLPICSPPQHHPSPICSPPQHHPSPIVSPPQQPLTYPCALLRSNTPFYPSSHLRSNPSPTHLLASAATPHPSARLRSNTPHPSARLRSNTPHPSARLRSNTPFYPSSHLRSNPSPTHLLASAATPPPTHRLTSAATPHLPICSPPQQHPVLPIVSPPQQPLTYPSARLRSNTPHPSARLRSNTPHPSARLRSNTPHPSIRWLLEDELVSALRHSRVIGRSVLRKVLSHVCESEGRAHCSRELVQLQFVFGPENSLQKFKEEFRRLSLSGYQLNGEDDYYYVSLSRHHAQRAHATSAPHLAVQAWPEPDAGTAPESVEEELPGSKAGAEDSGGWTLEISDSDVSSVMSGMSALEQGGKSATEVSLSDRGHAPPKTSSDVSLPESVQSGNNSGAGSRQRPSRVQSFVSSHGSMDSDHLGYDAGSSDSECEDAMISEQDSRCPVMPKFWLIVKVHQDRVEVCTHASVGVAREVEELGESQRLHELVVRKVGEICRMVNQRLLLQDLHDTHLCNTLLVAESEEDIWKSESPYATYRQRMLVGEDFPGEESYQPRDYLAATMHFIPGHFACDTVWSTVIHIHPRLKMGPNMGVSRAIQSLRSVLNAFSVVNRKNMFVYQERATKSVFYLRLSETSSNGRLWDADLSQSLSRSLALSRSQEPIFSEDMMGSRLSLDFSSSRNSDSSRPVGQMDKHILLQVHGVGEAGSEITDDLVKVLRKRLDEATLDIITVMLQRNCKLTPADVEFIQPRGTPPTEVLLFTIPQSSLPCLQAMAYYLRQNLLIFLHTPKYTDSNGEHHFQHYYHSTLPELDLFLYNKPGGQGTGGKGIACIALSFVDQHGALVTQAYGERTGPPLVCPSTTSHLLSASTFESLTKVSRFAPAGAATDSSAPMTLVRFDVWEKGNISASQLSERLANSLRHALCDVIIEFHILQMPLCVDLTSPADQEAAGNGKGPSQSLPDMKGLAQSCDKSRPAPVTLPPLTSPSGTDPSTPPSKTGRRSFWDMLSKADNAELGPPKTTDDIVSERTEEPRTRRRHKTESLKAPCYPDRPGLSLEHAHRKRQTQLEEGDIGTLHPLYSHTCLQWMNFMNQLGCPSVQLCSVQTISRFLLPSILTELFSIITSLASDTSVRVFEKITGPEGAAFVPYSTSQHSATRPAAAREMTLLGRNFRQWRYNTEQAQKGFQRFEAMELSSAERPLDLSPAARALVPRQRFLLIEIQDKKLTLYTYNWSPDLGASLSRSLVRLIQWQSARAHVVHCLLNQKMGLFHHYCFTDAPWHEDSKQDPNPFLNSTLEVDALIRSPTPPPYKEQTRLGASGRGLPSLHYPADIVPFDEVLRDVMPGKPMSLSSEADTVSRHGTQFLEIKSTEKREVEKQMKIENLFVTWQQRSAQSNMPISAADLDTLKQSARMVHYCATPLLFDPSFQVQVQNDQSRSEGKGAPDLLGCDVIRPGRLHSPEASLGRRSDSVGEIGNFRKEPTHISREPQSRHVGGAGSQLGHEIGGGGHDREAVKSGAESHWRRGGAGLKRIFLGGHAPVPMYGSESAANPQKIRS